ncbi:hypothetical protein TNCV_1876431 [Trichonephila clavipes]|nr:hypothetical protein TNCV_1876431 [Trichonephila clavipes]
MTRLRLPSKKKSDPVDGEMDEDEDNNNEKDMFQADLDLQHLQETVLSVFRPEGEEEFLCRNLLQTTL